MVSASRIVVLRLWLQSIQLSIFALPIALTCMVGYDARALLSGDLLRGFGRGWAWLTVALSALGGIAVSMALKCACTAEATEKTHPQTHTHTHTHTPLAQPRTHPPPPTRRYADNILKTFAVGCSIVLNCGMLTTLGHSPSLTRHPILDTSSHP